MRELRLAERDLALLKFLWKWKVATTSAVSFAFFEGNVRAAYKRLWQLGCARFVTARSIDDCGSHFVWSLDRKGFAAIRCSLPHLHEEGYKSENLGHDLLTMAFHLGDAFIAKSQNTTLFSEQQLRRYDFEFYPKPLPRNNLHRPDGYTILQDEKDPRTIAWEVELTPKKKGAYEDVAEFYSDNEVDQVFWLVPRATLAKRIYAALGDFREAKRHSFVLLDSFTVKGWCAEIFCGKGENQRMNVLLGNKPETIEKQVSARSLLDTRKAPHRSQTCRLFSLGKNLD